MVKPLRWPARPLPRGGQTASWRWRAASDASWTWCRVYHRGTHTTRGETPRRYGPLARFDPHTPPTAAPSVDPAERSVIYIGADLATSACEVFGELGEAPLCPSWRVAKLRPTRTLTLFDLCEPGAALAIGALPALADGDLPRALTQEWARAIYEDDPTGQHVDGVRYRSAYNGGRAIAAWDADFSVTVLKTGDGEEADHALRYPPLLERLMVELAPRRIMISIIDPDECPHCRRDAEPEP